ncbi:MAG: hypothetical protein HS116_26555 [Planctomycetes bacterium]|nr:hypothetical protein [Planctomycetota bacterium]
MGDLGTLDLDIPPGVDFDQALQERIQNLANRMATGLKEVLGDRVEVTLRLKTWERTEEVRSLRKGLLAAKCTVELVSGWHRGAAIALDWDRKNPELVEVSVTPNTKLKEWQDSLFLILAIGIALNFVVLRIFVSGADLNFILAGLGILIGSVVGAVVCWVVGRLLGNRAADLENEQLVSQVEAWIRETLLESGRKV